MNKLTVEQCERIIRNHESGIQLTGVEVYRQLLELMRENERLREALNKKGCPACDSAKYYAVVGDPRIGVGIKADEPYKHFDNDTNVVSKTDDEERSEHESFFQEREPY